VDAGRYVNLWIPSVSFWSFLQTHLFTVISWAAKEQDTLDLLIEPQRGLTRELLYHAKKGYTINPIVIFTGRNVAMDEFESILIVASGFGIIVKASRGVTILRCRRQRNKYSASGVAWVENFLT
jgi:hypothetical protein